MVVKKEIENSFEKPNTMSTEFQRKVLEDEDAMRDSQRKMAWFSLFGMLLYPICVLIASAAGMSEGAQVLGDMAPTYFVSVAAIVAAFYGFDNRRKRRRGE